MQQNQQILRSKFCVRTFGIESGEFTIEWSITTKRLNSESQIRHNTKSKRVRQIKQTGRYHTRRNDKTADASAATMSASRLLVPRRDRRRTSRNGSQQTRCLLLIGKWRWLHSVIAMSVSSCCSTRDRQSFTSR